ncbi:hypothetical protein D623_10028003 [Myotis brandtii]|uniref:Uncharacterized protein n=1 Tax=Myotis brandtii TaxID=109478 RepID=S7PM21_MYOBR|nr:hypothetical protein D623_10028003 [Myotis brandtii]
MASPSGSPEDKGKLRGRDGRQRREEEDAPPEEKRLRLGLEGGSAAQEEGEDALRLGREETGTQTGVEGRGHLPKMDLGFYLTQLPKSSEITLHGAVTLRYQITKKKENKDGFCKHKNSDY